MSNVASLFSSPSPNAPQPGPVSEIRFKSLHDATNMLAPQTTFVGRDGELAALGEALQTPGCVSLVGPGGVGKSRLVTELVSRNLAELLLRHPGGVWHCDLDGVRTVERACAAMVSTLALPTSSATAAQIAEALSQREPVLLVLDNVEQVAAELGHLVRALRSGSPSLVVLVTSRQPLRLAGERCLRIRGLSLPSEEPGEAMRLFAERASEVRGGYTMSASEAPFVQEIVERLDGLPLAIELAANRMRVLGAAQIAGLLSQRFKLLVRSDHGLPSRQTALRAVIDESWEMLDESERRALCQCATFEGLFTLDDACGVVKLDTRGAPWAIDVLQRLCDRSLIEVHPRAPDSPEQCYRLYESVRAYARERVVEAQELAHSSCLQIAASGRYFAPPNEPQVCLQTRRALRLILKALADRHDESPGEAITLDGLVAIGWPGERVLAEAAASRVYTAVALLRRMGLRKVLMRRDDGYLLDPTIELVRDAG